MRLRSTWLVPLAALLALVLPAMAEQPSVPETFNVDPNHSSVGFAVRHLVTKVRGTFGQFTGAITVPDRGKPELASVKFTIQATSIDTTNVDRDKHLRSPDFFDVQKFPEITFESTKIEALGAGAYLVTGRFTMHGVTKEIGLPVTFAGTVKDPWGGERAGFSLALVLNRKEYGISYNKILDSGGALLGDDVEITIDLEAVKTQPAKK